MSVLKSYGKERANKNACPDNVLKLEACACTDKESCQDLVRQSVPLVSGIALLARSVTIEGKQYSFKEGIPIDNPDLIRVELKSIFDSLEIGTSFSWEYVDEELTIEHIGAHFFEQVTLSDGTIVSLTRNCNVGQLCDYQTQVVGDPGDLLYEGSTQTLASAPYAFDNAGTTAAQTANQATADTLKADLETALTALSVAYDSVTVTADDELESYLISIVAPKEVPGSDPVADTVIKIGEKELVNCGCTEYYLREDGTRGLALVAPLKKGKKRAKS